MTDTGQGIGLEIGHDAFFFDDAGDLLDVALEFAAGATATGEHLAVVCADDENRLLAETLGDRPDVEIIPQDAVYLRAPGAVDYYRRLALRAFEDGATRLRVLGQVPVESDPARRRDWARFEAVWNEVMADLPVWSTCVYNRRTSPPEILDSAVATHPMLRYDTGRGPNPAYVTPATYLAGAARAAVLPVEAAPPVLAVEEIDQDAVRLTRERVRLALADHVRTSPVVPAWSRIDDVVLAVHEVTDNAVRHGKPPVSLRLWTAGPDVVCRVTDTGAGVTDPFAGYARRGTAMGLWVGRQLCEELDFHHNDRGFTVRLRLSLEA